MLRYPEEIKEIIRDVDKAITRDGQADKLKGKLPMVLLGGSAIMMAHGGGRWTKDIDIMHTRAMLPMGKYLSAFHVVSDSVANLHPDYKERIEKQYELNNIEVSTLSPIDIAIAKTSRGLVKDFHDLYASDISESFDITEFEGLYREAMQYWIGNQPSFEANLSEAVFFLKLKKTNKESKLLPAFTSTLDSIASAGLINGSLEVKALRLLAAENTEQFIEGAKDRKTMALATYLADSIGESLFDSKEEVYLGTVLQKHFSLMAANTTTSPADEMDALKSAGSALKLFKTVATETVKTLTEEQKRYLAPLM